MKRTGPLAALAVLLWIQTAGAWPGGEAPRKIIDEDNLVEITDTGSFPWSAVVWIRGHYDHKNNKCTGAMVASNLVLTSAHCLYDWDDDAWALSIDVAPGKTGKNDPFGKVSTEWYQVSEEYVMADEFDRKKHDWGLIVLPEDVGAATGVFRLDVAETEEFINYPLHIASYPDDDDCGGCPYDGRRMFYDTNKAFYTADLFVDHLMDTLSGSSGAGIWMEKACGLPQVVSVHRGGYSSGEENTSTRITADLVGRIVELVLESGGEMFCPGYEGDDPCCGVDDPCGLADNGGCQCGGTCAWEVADCEDCVPQCEAMSCGPDGCGGNCGLCWDPAGACCRDGECGCEPLTCERLGRECGTWDDGCEGLASCGVCDDQPGSQCQDGICVCVPDCEGRTCGPDGCDGDCGTCDDGLTCTEDSCVESNCDFALSPYFCVIADTCLPSGTEDPLNACRKCRPALDGLDWSPVEDGLPCGGGLVCQQGACGGTGVEPMDAMGGDEAGQTPDIAELVTEPEAPRGGDCGAGGSETPLSPLAVVFLGALFCVARLAARRLVNRR